MVATISAMVSCTSATYIKSRLLTTENSGSQGTAIVLGGHGFSIGTGRADGNEIAPVAFVQDDALAEYVGTFTTGSHHIVGELWTVG